VSAQIGSQPTATEVPKASDAAENTNVAHAKWTESLGEPSMYVNYARVDVGQRHYKSATRNLRKAAAILAEQLKYAYGLDRRRLAQNVSALRLTARDVSAGAITSPAQLDSILDTTHAYLRERETAPE
jgi:predicted metal-dependent hydrolase